MSGLKALIPPSVIACALALTFAVPAAANTDVASCQVNGTAATDEVPLTGPSALGSTYLFSSSNGATPLGVSCVGFDEQSHEVAYVKLAVDSTGTYNNIICGTGTTLSLAGQTTVVSEAVLFDTGPGAFPIDLVTAVDGAAYGITFVNETGSFRWIPGTITSVGGTPAPSDGTITISAAGDEPDGSSAAQRDASGTGIQPGGHNDCTDHFTVSGSVTGQFLG